MHINSTSSYIFIFFFFHWHYSPLWALACRTMSFHFFLSATDSLHFLTPSTWRSLSTSSFHPFLGLPLLLVPSSSWVKIFLGILSSSILSNTIPPLRFTSRQVPPCKCSDHTVSGRNYGNNKTGTHLCGGERGRTEDCNCHVMERP